jgi:hypothetical protein
VLDSAAKLDENSTVISGQRDIIVEKLIKYNELTFGAQVALLMIKYQASVPRKLCMNLFFGIIHLTCRGKVVIFN